MSKNLNEKIFDHFPQILTYGVILAPKMYEFWTFSPKMTYFEKIDPINDIFAQNYVHKPDWNNFYKLLVKKLFTTFHKF